jgi:hypothetical protein
MSIVLQSSGGGSVTLEETVTASNYTITVPAVTGTMATTTTPSFTTTIGVGGATPAASGAGITFPTTQSASSDANTLDDYEEGTWTCTITMGSGSATLSSGANTGAYTKIGRQVTITGLFNINAVSSPSGSFTLNGLPFALDGSITNLGERTAGVFAMSSFASNDGTGSLILESGTTPFARAYQFGNPVPDSSCEFWISLTYFTS